MPCKAILSGWNGTLTGENEEERNLKLLDALVYDAGQDLKRLSLRSLFDTLTLARRRRLARRSLEVCRRDGRPPGDFYNHFNTAIRGRDAGLIERTDDKLDDGAEVDMRVLGTIHEMHNSLRVATGILSAAYERRITLTLSSTKYTGAFDSIIANTLNRDRKGMTLGFTSGTRDGKYDAMQTEFMRKRCLSGSEILYIGGEPGDEHMAELLPRGNFIVPFMAPDGVKDHMSEKYGAFVPEDEPKLLFYMRGKCGLQSG